MKLHRCIFNHLIIQLKTFNYRFQTEHFQFIGKAFLSYFAMFINGMQLNKQARFVFELRSCFLHLQIQIAIFRNNYKLVVSKLLIYVFPKVICDNAYPILIVYDNDGNRYRREPNRNTLLWSVLAPGLDTPLKASESSVPGQCDLVDLASRWISQQTFIDESNASGKRTRD